MSKESRKGFFVDDWAFIYLSRGVALRMMIEVCIRLVMLSLTVPKTSLNSDVSGPTLGRAFEIMAHLLGLVPDTIEHATPTVRVIG